EQIMQIKYEGLPLKTGTGLHDSSAALIPYLTSFKDPFILLSTGTWCISLNPFNTNPLTEDELKKDVLCYLTYTGKPVKASRLLLGPLYEHQVKRIASFYNQAVSRYHSMPFNAKWMDDLEYQQQPNLTSFSQTDMSGFKSDEEAYHHLMYDMALLQRDAIYLVLKNSPVKYLFVDGGFSTNTLYMNMLTLLFPQLKVYAASMPQGSALGAALVIHDSWNSQPIPDNLITLKSFDKHEFADAS
ncbi:carbohydrate kinase, partial [Fulvivirgaceae bacterium PWU20]